MNKDIESLKKLYTSGDQMNKELAWAIMLGQHNAKVRVLGSISYTIVDEDLPAEPRVEVLLKMGVDKKSEYNIKGLKMRQSLHPEYRHKNFILDLESEELFEGLKEQQAKDPVFLAKYILKDLKPPFFKL